MRLLLNRGTINLGTYESIIIRIIIVVVYKILQHLQAETVTTIRAQRIIIIITHAYKPNVDFYANSLLRVRDNK